AASLGGIDPAKALKRLQAVGVDELWQVPLFLPTRFLDAREPVDQFFGLQATDREVVVIGRYAGDLRTRWRQGVRGRQGPQAQGTLVDVSGMRVRFSIFGDARTLEKALEDRTYLNNPVIVEDELLGQLIPHYPGKARVLSQTMVRRVVLALLPHAIPVCAARLRETVLKGVEEHQLRRVINRPSETLEELLWEAHLPSSPKAGEEAQQSLERLSALVTVGEVRKLQQEHPPVRRVLRIAHWDDLLARVPFSLTDEQEAAVVALVQRFGGQMTSSTLINADVGMGKSIIYQLATAAAVRAGARSVVLLPNERLAVQAHEEIKRLFPELAPMLVTGKSRKADLAHG